MWKMTFRRCRADCLHWAVSWEKHLYTPLVSCCFYRKQFQWKSPFPLPNTECVNVPKPEVTHTHSHTVSILMQCHSGDMKQNLLSEWLGETAVVTGYCSWPSGWKGRHPKFVSTAGPIPELVVVINFDFTTKKKGDGDKEEMEHRTYRKI